MAKIIECVPNISTADADLVQEAAGIVSTPEHNGDRTVLAPPPPRP